MAQKSKKAQKVNVEQVGEAVGKITKRINYNAVLVILLIGASFFIGRLSAQVEYLKGGVGGTVAAQPVQQGTAQPAQQVASKIDIAGLKVLAKEAKLDEKKFEQCLDSGKYQKKVADDQAYGGTLGVSGTPTFFINGVGLVGAQPQAKFEEVIEAELKDKSGDKVAGIEPGGRKTVNVAGYVQGNKNAAIRIVEFSDFECPFCARAFPTIEAVQAKYGDKVSLEYRHYPLSFHPNAQKAAEASECAGEQGKFWEMHDAMFKVQG